MAATVKVRNVGPFGRDIRPDGSDGDVLASVAPGEVVEVSAALAAGLLEQSDVWAPVATDKQKGDDK
jgi:hypothetical protein